MLNFEYWNPTRIIFGKDQFGALDTYVPKEANILITYGGGSAERTGLLDRVRTALGDRKFKTMGGIEPNPSYETLMKFVKVVKEEKIDFLLAVGGGSVIDGTKFIALAANYDGDATDLLKNGYPEVPLTMVSKATPIGTVLTIPATGSEMNNGAVISYGDGKFPVMSRLVFPQFSILDPTVTFTLPQKQVENGVVDTFVHTTEQYLTFPVDGRIQDRFAEGILQTLIEIGQTTINEPENYDARANHVWASTLALNTLIGSGVPQDWATHMIGHEITALTHIDHGRTLAIVLPSLLTVQKDKKMAKLVQYAERVWGITEGSDEEKADAAIAKTREFFESLGVPTKLSAYDLDKSVIDQVVKQLEEHGFTQLSEDGSVTPEVVRQILTLAY